MEYVNLLSASDVQESLASFAAKLFALVGIHDVVERESGNYPGGRYFRGSLEDLVFTISESDEEGHKDLPYWVQVTCEARSADDLTRYVDRLIQEKIIGQQFRAARMVNFGKRGEQRLDYPLASH